MSIERASSHDVTIERLKKAANVKTDSALAGVLGVTQGAVSAAKKRGTVPSSWYVRIAEKSGVPADWLMFGAAKTEERDVLFAGEEAAPPFYALNLVVLQDAIEAVEEFYSAREERLSPAAKAKVIAALYRMGTTQDKDESPGCKALQMARVLAESLP